MHESLKDARESKRLYHNGLRDTDRNEGEQIYSSLAVRSFSIPQITIDRCRILMGLKHYGSSRITPVMDPTALGMALMVDVFPYVCVDNSRKHCHFSTLHSA